MIIGIMSDSHGDARAVERGVRAAGRVDLWLHAGDLYTDAEVLAAHADCEVIAVAGNCDSYGADYPQEKMIEVAGKKIYLAHGHHLGVKFGMEMFVQTAASCGAEIAVYGHTHIQEIAWYDRILVINPGSVARPRFAPGTIALLKIDDVGIDAKFVELS